MTVGQTWTMRSLLRSSVALLLVLGLAACSGSDSKESAKDEDSTTTSSTTTTIKNLDVDAIDVEASPYCKTWSEIRALGAPTITGDHDKDVASRKAHYAKVVPLAERLVSQADKSIKPAAQYALDQVRAVAKDGSEVHFTDAAANARQQELAGYALEHCSKD
jgi:hypothetical protein